MLPSFWSIALIIFVVVALERTYWLFNRFCKSADRNTAGFSQLSRQSRQASGDGMGCRGVQCEHG